MRHCVSESLDKRIKALTEGAGDCCCDTKYSIMRDIDDDACICEPEAIEVIEDDFVFEDVNEGRMSSDEARNLAKKEAIEIGLTGPGYTNYVNRRSRELIMGEDVPEDAPIEEDIASDAAEAIDAKLAEDVEGDECADIEDCTDGNLQEAVINEGAWKKELASGADLRKAINSEDPTATANALLSCYAEILSDEDLDEDERYEIQNALDDFKVVFANGENGELDHDTYDESEIQDAIDYYLNEFYDICDAYKIWVSLDESLGMRIQEAFGDDEYKEDEWDPEDIELHKSIDWKDRNWEDYPVEGSEIDGEATLYTADREPETVATKMKKYLRANPMYPPYYRAENSPFANRRGVVGSMYNGKKNGKYGIHDRYEDQKLYNIMSETLAEGKDIMKYDSVGKMLHAHMGEVDLNADEATLKRQLIGLLNNYQSEISDKKGLMKAKELFTKLRGPRLLSTIATYMTGDRVNEATINRRATAGDKFRAFMGRHGIGECTEVKEEVVDEKVATAGDKFRRFMGKKNIGEEVKDIDNVEIKHKLDLPKEGERDKATFDKYIDDLKNTRKK